MDKKTKKSNNTRDFFVEVKAVEGEGNERKVLLSFSSEEPYERFFGNEILSHAAGAVDLTRLNEIGVTLYNHNRDEVIGKITRAWIENGRGYAEIEFDDDEFSEKIFRKVINKTLKGVSVGYKVEKWEDVAAGETSQDGRFKGPCSIAVKWMPFEISIVSIPADATVGVGRDLEESSGNTLIYERQLEVNKNLLLLQEEK